MEKMYQDYKDVADIYIVYIREAHAADSSWPVPYAKEKGITDHTNFGERCEVAERLVKDKKLTIPCLVDAMDNNANKAYSGWPDRLFIVRKDGKLGIAGGRGPFGFVPALEAAEKWLADFKKNDKEPEIGKYQPDTSRRPRMGRRRGRNRDREPKETKPDP